MANALQDELLAMKMRIRANDELFFSCQRRRLGAVHLLTLLLCKWINIFCFVLLIWSRWLFWGGITCGPSVLLMPHLIELPETAFICATLKIWRFCRLLYFVNNDVFLIWCAFSWVLEMEFDYEKKCYNETLFWWRIFWVNFD